MSLYESPPKIIAKNYCRLSVSFVSVNGKKNGVFTFLSLLIKFYRDFALQTTVDDNDIFTSSPKTFRTDNRFSDFPIMNPGKKNIFVRDNFSG